MSTSDNTNLSLDDLKAVVHKVKEEARREGYSDGAQDAVLAFCRAIGIPGIYVSRPSLWQCRIDRTGSLEAYTDELGAEALSEVAELVADHIEAAPRVTLDSMFDNDTPADVSPLTMPMAPMDVAALDQSGAFDV